MRTLRTVRAVTRWRRPLQREGVSIALVPTMGALHDGHRALIRAARLTCDAVVVSIFVNPLQFGPREDFGRYPRQLARDVRLCRGEGVDVVFAPSVAEMYPPSSATTVAVPALARRWEGAHRPGHFEGVATVVTKLLAIVKPVVAIFGQKDFQQAAVIRRLAIDLNLGTAIRIHPTVRERDGLAVSSRNVFLTPAQRRAAPALYRSLLVGRAAIRAGARDRATVERIMRAALRRERSMRLDYLAVCDAETLEPAKRVRGTLVLLGAARLGRIRLIDNLTVKSRR